MANLNEEDLIIGYGLYCAYMRSGPVARTHVWTYEQYVAEVLRARRN